MPIVERLMRAAQADTGLLRLLDSQGDRFSLAREVGSVFVARAREGGHGVRFPQRLPVRAGERRGRSRPARREAVLDMPIEQHLALAVSGFMVCVAERFGVAYDGWSGAPQTSVTGDVPTP